ncbi:hypothetical protein G6F31_019716 [Rhizopus arrhizus]|nr:hypothetical protein G6F31_019716 [Rhizopus arrhizus]
MNSTVSSSWNTLPVAASTMRAPSAWGWPIYDSQYCPSRSPTTGIDVIQLGTATPWRLAAMAQAKKVLASLMAYDSARLIGTISTTITTRSASDAATAVRPPQRTTRRWYRGQLAKPMISAASAGTRKPLRK